MFAPAFASAALYARPAAAEHAVDDRLDRLGDAIVGDLRKAGLDQAVVENREGDVAGRA
jgi:hypothetical protein